MNYNSKIRKLCIKGIEQNRTINAKINNLKKQEQGYYKPTFEALMNDLEEERTRTLFPITNELAQLVNQYKEDVHQRFIPKGDDITSDIALLTNNAITTGAEVDALFSRYKSNFTMQKLIYDYANQKGISHTSTIPTEASFVASVDNLMSYYKEALKHDDYASLFTDDASYEKISSDTVWME